MIGPRLGVAVIRSPLEVGAEKAPEIEKGALSNLKKLNLDIVTSETIIQDDESVKKAGRKFKEEEVDLICLIAATWSEDHLVLDLLEEVDSPLITWALPGIDTGSLCGCQQICCVLKELNKTYKFVYGELDDAQAHKKIEIFSRAVALRQYLRKTRLGLIGYRIPGMTEVTFDELELKSLLGPRVVHLGINKLVDAVAKIPDAQAGQRWEKVRKSVGKVNVKKQEGLHSIKTYLALKGFVDENKLSGLAIECYPALMGEVCLGASLLSEEGIVTACEGDVNSALAMLILYCLTGKPIHNTDILAIYDEDNSIVLSHCGSGGFSLAEKKSDITLNSVRLANKGICVLFPARSGPVTMINIVGRKDTYRMAIMTGEAIKTDMVFPGNPIRIKCALGVRDILQTIAREGIGHHWMVGYSDVRQELAEFCSLTNIRGITISACQSGPTLPYKVLRLRG